MAESGKCHWRWLVAGVVLLGGCSNAYQPPIDPPGSFSFAVLGDAPYRGLEFPRYRHVLEEIDNDNLAFVIHVGDILWYPCTDETFKQRLEDFQRLRHAVIYTPGDNEWADCHEQIAGSFKPLERLRALREIFYTDPHHSLGGSELPLSVQADDPRWSEFVENTRWLYADVLFVTIHMPGSWNAGSLFETRGVADDTASRLRTEAAVDWLKSAFAYANTVSARAIVIATHADMNLNAPPDDKYRQSYEPLPDNLELLIAGARRPVLLLHGDNHEYIVDQPLHDRRTGQKLANMTRLEVMGAPDIGWVRVTLTADPEPVFSFVPRISPWWLVW